MMRDDKLCIGMHRNVLFDRWRTSFYVMAIMEWVHIVWNGIIGNPGKAGLEGGSQPAST